MIKINKFGVIQENLTKLFKAIRLNRRIFNMLNKTRYNQHTFTCKSEYLFTFITENDELQVLQDLPIGQQPCAPELKIYTSEFMKLAEPYKYSFPMPNLLRNSYYINTTPNESNNCEIQLIANYHYILQRIKNVALNKGKFTVREMKYMNQVYEHIKLL